MKHNSGSCSQAATNRDRPANLVWSRENEESYQGGLSGSRNGDALSARDQGQPQGNDAGGGQAADPVRGGRGGRRRHHRDDFHHRPFNKRAIEDHFDKAYELESELEHRGKTELLEFVRNMIPRDINCIYIRQPEALGLGHAVLCARPAVGDEPFAVLLADDLLDGQPPVMKQMTDIYDTHGSSVIGVQQVAREDTKSYGIVDSKSMSESLEQVLRIVEKPRPEDAPSTLAVVGRYVLTPRIFHHLSKIGKGSGGEIQLTDGIAALLAEEQVLAYRYQGTRYDCGSKLGYLEATVAFGLRHPEVGKDFAAMLKSM
jgi:UTP--glucose-1-phosphate uridylyltransferase